MKAEIHDEFKLISVCRGYVLWQVKLHHFFPPQQWYNLQWCVSVVPWTPLSLQLICKESTAVRKIFVHKGMGGKTSPGEGDQRFEVLWTLKSMIFHLVNQGPSWLFYGWQTEVSRWMKTHRNIFKQTYI